MYVRAYVCRQPDAMTIFSNLGEYTESVKAEKQKNSHDVSVLQNATEVRM